MLQIGIVCDFTRERMPSRSSANGPNEDTERSNGKMLQRHRRVVWLRGSEEHFCGSFLDAEGGEIKLHGPLLGAHVQDDQDGIAATRILAQEREYVRIIAIQRHVASVPQGWFALVQSEQAFVKRENGVWVLRLDAYVVLGSARRDREPGMFRGAEPGIFRRVPLHRSALAVATFFFRPADFPDGILDVFLARGRGGPHANFFAVIHQRCLASS